MNAQRAPLPGNRWHFAHGPIDLVIGADGDAHAVAAAHEAAWRRFENVLAELVAELPLLRRPVAGDCPLRGPVAARMWRACQPFRERFVTPMAAVAGSVAEEIVAFYRGEGVERAWVNNGGDIALHLQPGRSVAIGLFADLSQLEVVAAAGGPIDARHFVDGRFEIRHAMPVRGVATSGWRGRSFSLGIADSVTVLASTASQADAAATIVANAVNLDDPRIRRQPACELKDDTDLGELPVTVDVPVLDAGDIDRALDAGERCAQDLCAAGLLHAAVLVCQRRARIVGVGLDETEQENHRCRLAFAS